MFVIRVGSVVKIRVDIQTGTKTPVFPFSFECINEEYAELVKTKVHEIISGLFDSVQEEAYQNGYRDGKNHRAFHLRGSRPWSFDE